MQYDTKIRLDAEMVAAIDFARTREPDMPSRAEMIRRILYKGLAANLRQLATVRLAIERDTKKKAG